jgi:thiol-disulfide isomerase/thioredoxin
MSTRRWTGILMVALLVGVLSGSALAQKPEPTDVGDLMDRIVPALVNNKGEAVDDPKVLDKDYILFYWSASWCGPCKRFTPKLLEVYNKLGGGERFEVVLMSADKTEEKMLAYMKDTNMPWYAIDFDERKGTGINTFAGGGIPHLMLIDKNGKILGRGRGQASNVLRKLILILDPNAVVTPPAK